MALIFFGARVATGGNEQSQPACGPPGCEASPPLKSAPVVVQPFAPAQPAPCPYCHQDAKLWQKQTSVAPPEIGGEAAAVVEAACGTLILGLNQDQRLPPASLTKIATALVVVGRARLSDRVAIALNGWDLAAADDSSIMGLEAGMSLTVEELLYGLLLPSGNDAALALAGHLGGKERFVALMNQRVAQLGLKNTRFSNPDGRHDDGLYSSALDMALLGRELLLIPALRKIVGTQTFRPNWNGQLLWNGNYLLYYYPGAIGVKTGYTEQANNTIVGAAERDGRVLIATVLATWNPYGDARRLLDWAFANTRPACAG